MTQVAPVCQDTGGLAHLCRGTRLMRKLATMRKKVHEKEHLVSKFLSYFTFHALGCTAPLVSWDRFAGDQGSHTSFGVLGVLARLFGHPTMPGGSSGE
jgi:hypothetical protein